MSVTFTRKARMAVLASGLGLGVAAAVWAVSAEGDTPPMSPPVGTSAIPLSGMPKRPVSSFDTIAARPLFLKSRRPAPPKPLPAAAPDQGEPPTAPPLAATLLGVVVSPNVRSAIVRLASGKNVTVAEGEILDGWELKHVTPESARFERKSGVAELTFPIRQASTGPASRTALPGALQRRGH